MRSSIFQVCLAIARLHLLNLFNFRHILSGRGGRYFEQYENEIVRARTCAIRLVRSESLHNLPKCFWLGSFFKERGYDREWIKFVFCFQLKYHVESCFSRSFSQDSKSFRYLIFHLASIDIKDRDINYGLSRYRVKFYLYIFYFSFISLLFFSFVSHKKLMPR